METKKLFRSVDDNIVAGVCGGLAEYFQIDGSLVRIIFILLAIGGGSGVLIYLILWLVVPSVNQNSSGKQNKEEKIKEFADEVKDKTKSMAKEIKLETKIKRTKRINILGVVLILIGLTAIWNQIFPKMIDWDMFWPIILILVGMLLIFRD
ncbi:MAG: PspC domain-containing protein [Candidatus Shapirobacteria bacterium]|nr:PspC domain-containing protein [Candidatus Shapirobacteria bacterium]MDD3002728.1 PspC domain-containing protein [Candidatus Shapirobacteria bacterium]MDD4382917.1 PspC domain-containing protein [Candidatus Shapirobacteria bacterium]